MHPSSSSPEFSRTFSGPGGWADGGSGVLSLRSQSPGAVFNATAPGGFGLRKSSSVSGIWSPSSSFNSSWPAPNKGPLLASLGFRPGSTSAGASTDSFSPSRQGNRVMPGLSVSAENFNERQDRSFDLLVQESVARDVSDNVLRKGLPTVTYDEEGFLRAAASLVSNVDNLRSKHDAFEPNTDGQGSSLSRSNTRGKGGSLRSSERPAWMALSREELERQSERIEAYKMARRVEPELPPMSRTPLFDIPPRGKLSEIIIAKNAQPEALQSFSIHARKEVLNGKMAEREARTNHATIARTHSLDSLCGQFEEVIERKRHQGEKAVAIRREPKRVVPPVVFLQERWVSICMAFKCAQALKEKLERGKSLQHMKQFDSKRRKPAQRNSTLLLHQAASAFSNESNGMEVVAAMIRKRNKVKEIKHNAQVVMQSMQGWSVAGQVFLALRRFVLRIVKVQRWWKENLEWIKKIRERISKRWEELERMMLMREIVKRAPGPPGQSRNKSSVALPTLSVEEKVALEKIDEVTRLRFIDNEMRARRYNLLPQILLWEEENRTWRANELSDWQETNQIAKMMGGDIEGSGGDGSPAVGSAAMFKWPPTMPSYTPKLYPVDGSPGVLHGDEEILVMIRACKNHPQGKGWREMVLPKTKVAEILRGKPGRRPSKMGRRGTTGAGKDVAKEEVAARPFGEASDDELSKWGCTAARMPGLSSGDSEAGGPASINPF